MKTRILHTRFWHEDSYINSLKPKQKLYFMYLFTNSYANISGIYELPIKYRMVDTGLNEKEIESFQKKFMDDLKYGFIDNWVIILNNHKYNNYTGEKNNRAKEKEMLSIPKQVIELRNILLQKKHNLKNDTLSIDYLQHADSPINQKSEIINQESGIRNHKPETNKSEKRKKNKPAWDKEYSSQVLELTSHFIEILKQNDSKIKIPSETKKWAYNIDLLIRKDGRTEQEIYQVIDFAVNDRFWSSIILSTSNLRDKFQQLYLKSRNNKSKYKENKKEYF